MCQYKQPIQKRNLITYLDKGFNSLVYLGQKILISGKNFDNNREFIKLPISYDLLFLPESRICTREEKELFLRNKKYFDAQKLDILFKHYNVETYNDLVRQYKAEKRQYVKLYDNDSLFDTYLLNDSTGEIIPVFDFVDCGKCPKCVSKKELHYKQKIVGQVEQECQQPLFITLTYNASHYPTNNINLTSYHVRELQLFLKRLRKEINDEYQIKYFAVSEFGSKNHRLHYHLLLFGIPETEREYQFSTLSVRPKFTEKIEKCWNKGFVYCKFANDANVSSYLSKYLTKQNNVKLQSNHLGKDFLLSYKDYIKNNDKQIIEYNSYDGVYSKLYVNSYLINLALPSVARLIPKKERDEIQKMLYNLSLLKNKEYFHYVLKCIERHFDDKIYNYFNIKPININIPYSSELQDKQKQYLTQLEISSQIQKALNLLESKKVLFLQGLENEEIRTYRFTALTNIVDETINNYNINSNKNKIIEYDNQ